MLLVWPVRFAYRLVVGDGTALAKGLDGIRQHESIQYDWSPIHDGGRIRNK
jgi:hypothetical protein